jgi:FixJ family two-component response regulator
MTGKPSLVSVVDDDESVRESLPDLLRQLGFAAEAFSSAEAFLASAVLSETSCLLLDIVMPGMSGPDLQRGTDTATAKDSGCVHHRPRRRVHRSAPAGARGR